LHLNLLSYHDLTVQKFVPWPTYRGLSDGDKCQVNALHAQGVGMCEIMGYLMDQKCGPHKIRFSRKHLDDYMEGLKHGKIID